MQDAEPTVSPRKGKKAVRTGAMTEGPERKGRQSELSTRTNTTTILNGLLNTEVKLSLGDLLGTSKELAQRVHEITHYRNKLVAQTDAQVQLIQRDRPSPQVMPPKTESKPLIYCIMEHHGRQISAVIDTGSQINVIQETVARRLGLAIDKSVTTTMCDANGGMKELHGYVPNAKLNCGIIETHPGLNVGQDVRDIKGFGAPCTRGEFREGYSGNSAQYTRCLPTNA